MLVYHLVRASELCNGGEDAGRDCPDANGVTCSKCGAESEVEDTSVPGSCPQCGGRLFTVSRCDRCPVHELEYVRAHSAAGRLFERVLELEFACANFAVPWSEISAEEVKGLQVIKEERDRYQRDQQKKPQH